VKKYLLGTFDRDADPETVVATAREALTRLVIEVPEEESNEWEPTRDTKG
jgi:hypothetical protein